MTVSQETSYGQSGYDMRDQQLSAMKSLYKQSEVCALVNGMKTKRFSVSVGPQQGFVLSPLLFIIYQDNDSDKRNKESYFSRGVPFGNVMFGACCLQMTLHC